MRSLITTIIESVGLAMLSVAVGFQFGLWFGIGTGGLALVGVGVANS